MEMKPVISTHYLNLLWLDYRRLYASLGLNELTWIYGSYSSYHVISWNNKRIILTRVPCVILVIKTK